MNTVRCTIPVSLASRSELSSLSACSETILGPPAIIILLQKLANSVSDEARRDSVIPEVMQCVLAVGIFDQCLLEYWIKPFPLLFQRPKDRGVKEFGRYPSILSRSFRCLFS